MPKQQDLFNRNVMPAGDKPAPSEPVDADDNNQAGTGNQTGTQTGGQDQTGQDQGTPGQDKQTGQGQDKQTGQDTGDQSFKSLQKELTNLQNTVNQLVQGIQNNQSQSGSEAAAAGQTPDFNAQMAEIQKKVNEGDLDISDALAQAGEIQRQAAAQEFEQRLQEYDQERTAKEMYDRFLQDNPDFTQMDQDGTLDQLIQQNPMHDKFSAYFANKAQQLEQQVNDAYERGKQEGQKLATADESQRTVLSKPGASARQAHSQETKRKPANESEMVQNQLATLQKLREQRAAQ
jgi:hypothetical protein